MVLPVLRGLVLSSYGDLFKPPFSKNRATGASLLTPFPENAEATQNAFMENDELEN